jgi:hypothetical protein
LPITERITGVTVYLSTLTPGLARAEMQPGGKWSVEVIGPKADIRCLAMDPYAPRTVFAGTQGSGVLRSDDAGLTFAPSGLDGLIVKSLAVHPGRPGHLYAGTSRHVFLRQRTAVATGWS